VLEHCRKVNNKVIVVYLFLKYKIENVLKSEEYLSTLNVFTVYTVTCLLVVVVLPNEVLQGLISLSVCL